MRNLFIGMMFIFLDFHLTLNMCVIGLIPDFVGYYFILKGLQEFEGTSMYFDTMQSASKGMMIYSAVVYALDLLTVTAHMGVLATLFGVISLIGSLNISHNIVLGVGDLEKTSGRGMDSDVLLSRWKIMAIMNVAAVVLIWVPILNIASIVVTFISVIMYLVAFNKASNAYL